jgi:hypothetical protein
MFQGGFRDRLPEMIETDAVSRTDEDTPDASPAVCQDPVGRFARLLRFLEAVDLVADPDLWDVGSADLGQHPLDLVALLEMMGAGNVHHVQKQIGFGSLLERGLEGLDQLVRQVSDEADSV